MFIETSGSLEFPKETMTLDSCGMVLAIERTKLHGLYPFFLPSSVLLSTYRKVNTFQMHMDMGVMLLNFSLHTNIKSYCGVIMSHFIEKLQELSTCNAHF